MNVHRAARVQAILIAIVAPTLVTWLYFDVLSTGAPQLQQTAYGCGKLLQFLFPVAWLLMVPRFVSVASQSWTKRLLLANEAIFADQPHPTWSRRGSIGFGIGMGLLVTAAMWGMYRFAFPRDMLESLGSEVASRVERFSVTSWQSFALLGLFYAIVHSFLEEYYFRWFIFGQLRHVVSSPWAMIMSGLAFMAHHVIVLAHYFGGLSGMTIFLALCIAIGGFAWAWQYERSHSLLGPWLSHLIVDAGLFWIGFDLIAAQTQV